MLKNILILGIILVILNVLDVVTTLYLIRLGASEANPIADLFIQKSHLSFWVFKLGISLFVAFWLLFAVWKFPQLYKFSRNALVGVNIFYMTPFIWNVFGILVMRGIIIV